VHSVGSLFAPTNVLIARTSGVRLEEHCSHSMMLACEHPTSGGPDRDRGHIAFRNRADICCAITTLGAPDGCWPPGWSHEF
jgi:hypothetical protein